MTGTLLDVFVKLGDEVAAGDAVALVSAMKMEHRLEAGLDGVVTELRAQPGDNVEQGALIVRIEPHGA